MTTPAGPSSTPRAAALPWLAGGLLVSAGTASLVGANPGSARIMPDVTVLVVVGLVVLALVIDAVLPRVGALVAVLLLIAWSGAVGAVVACLAIVAGLGFVPAAFLVAAAVVAVAGFLVALRRRSRPASMVAEPAATPPGQAAPAVALALYLEPVNVVLSLVLGVNRFMGDSREDPGWNARHGIPAERRARPR